MLELEYQGKKYTLKQLEHLLGIETKVLRYRYRQGWRGDKLFKPVKSKQTYLVNGERLTVKQMHEKYDVSTVTLYNRIKRGITGSELIKPKKHGFTYNGVHYRIMQEAADKLGLNMGTLNARIRKHGLSQDLAMPLNEYLTKYKATPITIYGVHYNSIIEAQKATGLSRASLAKERKTGYLTKTRDYLIKHNLLTLHEVYEQTGLYTSQLDKYRQYIVPLPKDLKYRIAAKKEIIAVFRKSLKQQDCKIVPGFDYPYILAGNRVYRQDSKYIKHVKKRNKLFPLIRQGQTVDLALSEIRNIAKTGITLKDLVFFDKVKSSLQLRQISPAKQLKHYQVTLIRRTDNYNQTHYYITKKAARTVLKDKYVYHGLALNLDEWRKELHLSYSNWNGMLKQYGFTKAVKCAKKLYAKRKRQLYLTYRGQTLTKKQWAKRLNIKYITLIARINKYGLDSPKVFEPRNGKQWHDYSRITYNNETHSGKEWSKLIGISYTVFIHRYREWGLCSNTFNSARNIHSNCLNKANSKYTYNRQTLTEREWCQKLDLRQPTFEKRLARFGICAKTFSSKRINSRPAKKYEHNDKVLTVNEWGKELDINPETFRARLIRYGKNDSRTFAPGKLIK